MNWLDMIIVVAILIPTIMGLRVGIIRTVLFGTGLVAGIILAIRYYDPLAGWLTFISQPQVASIVAFIIILLVVILIAMLIAALLKWAASMLMLGWVNRLAGAALGFVVGAIVCGGILALWVSLAGVSGPIAGSFLAPVLLERFPVVWQYVQNLPGI
ncbi:MAG: CvpA family protein [Chloroflexi bacterium]|nr:CvpA family protein [Chloroflexota bacterium]